MCICMSDLIMLLCFYHLKQHSGFIYVFFFCICYRYFQALVNNMSFVKYREVYAAAAEVLGLVLRYVTERKDVSVRFSVNVSDLLLICISSVLLGARWVPTFIVSCCFL